MPVVIKEMHVRTVIERRIVSESEISEDIIRKIENRVVEKLTARENGLADARRTARRKNNR